MILTASEIVSLTGKVRPTWQARELKYLEIPYRCRSDGSLVVLWEDVRPQDAKPRKREPQLRLA